MHAGESPLRCADRPVEGFASPIEGFPKARLAQAQALAYIVLRLVRIAVAAQALEL